MKPLKSVGLFCLGAVIIFSLAYTNTFNRGDYNTKRINLKKGQTITQTIDLSKEGIIKKLCQPDTYSVYLRVKIGGKHHFQCKSDSKDMKIYLSQGTKKGIWPEITENKILDSNGLKLIKTQNTIDKALQEYIPINVELKIMRINNNISEAKIVLMEDGQEYGIIKLKVIKA